MDAQRRRDGQSLIEFIIIAPILFIILSGVVEFGFWMLQYSNMIQAVRNAARFAVDNDYRFTHPACTPVRTASCDETACAKDFYCKTALVAINNLNQYAPQVVLDPTTDDVVISAFTLTEGQYVTNRFPDSDGWSYYGNHSSRMGPAEIQNLLLRYSVNNTSTGYVLVEVFYDYHQLLKLPWFTVLIPDPIPLYTYTFMPLYSAAPTPTPAP